MKNLKSKIVTFVLALCLVVPCMFMLTACDWGPKNDNEKEDTHNYTVANSKKWDELFTGSYLNNGTVVMEGKIYNASDELVETGTMTMKSTATAKYVEDSVNDTIDYIVKKGDKWYDVTQSGDKWYGQEISVSEVANYTFAKIYGEIFADKFALFTYDETNHFYKGEDLYININNVYDYVKVYVEDGKLVKIEGRSPIDNTKYAILKFTFTNYRTTTINVPNWVVPTVANSEEWNELVAGDYLNNSTFTFSMNGVLNNTTSLIQTGILKSAGDVKFSSETFKNSTTFSGYIVKRDEKLYKLLEDSDKWYGTEISEDDAEKSTFAWIGSMLRDKFTSFVFDNVSNCYIADPFDDGVGLYESIKVYAEDGKIFKIEIKSADSTYDYTITELTSSDYGSTTVETPNWIVPTVANSEEWEELFTGSYLNNGTLAGINKKYSLSDEHLLTDTLTTKSTKTARYIVQTMGGQTRSNYIVQKDSKWYLLQQDEDKWYGQEISASNLITLGDIGKKYGDKFSTFRYDSTKHYYIVENLENDTYSVYDYVKIYVEDGKLVKIEEKITYSSNDCYYIYEYTFSDYGSTIVNVPQWILATVAESEWTNLLTGDYLNNVTLDTVGKQYNSSGELTSTYLVTKLKITNDARYITQTNGATTQSAYYKQESGKWYLVEQDGDNWTGREITAESVKTSSFVDTKGALYADKYSCFRYDSTNHCYVTSESLVINETNYEYVKIYVEDGKVVKIEEKITYSDNSYYITEYTLSNYGTTTVSVPQWTVSK